MKVKTKLRMLPFDYLQKIGRYNPEVHSGQNGPGYPKSMMEDLASTAKEGKEVMPLGAKFTVKYTSHQHKHNKFIYIGTASGKEWLIPSNWVVRV